jgi:hypothetical protein
MLVTFADIGLYSLDNTMQLQYCLFKKSYKQDVQSIATFTRKDESNACFKNITYVEMVTTEKPINVVIKPRSSVKRALNNNNTREHCE